MRRWVASFIVYPQYVEIDVTNVVSSFGRMAPTRATYLVPSDTADVRAYTKCTSNRISCLRSAASVHIRTPSISLGNASNARCLQQKGLGGRPFLSIRIQPKLHPLDDNTATPCWPGIRHNASMAPMVDSTTIPEMRRASVRLCRRWQ